MTLEETIWLAGFVDGEGYIGVVKKGAEHFQAQLRIATTHEPTMQYVANLLGSPLHVNTRKRGIYRDDPTPWKKLYITCIYDRKAEEVVGQLLPYLKTKDLQAEGLLQYRKTITQHNQTTSIEKKLERYKKQHEFYLLLRSLNQRGTKVPK